VDASGTQQIVRYTTNHDVNSSDGTPLQLFGGENGSMSAFAVAALMKGVPFVYNGQEVGMTTPITFPFTTVKIDWTVKTAVTAEYKKIIAFRNNNAAVRLGQLTSYSNADICAFTKEQTGDTVLVISNLKNSTINYSLPPALVNTSWQDAINGGNATLTGQLTLNPYSYFILKNQ
jgi:glycosidase